jgi:aspartate kinase
MLVLKFGGTSVGSPERMHALAGLIRSDARRIVVLSAVAGTTNSLVEIASLLTQNQKEKAKDKIDSLRKQYSTFIQQLFKTQEGLSKGKELIESHFSHIESFVQDVFTVHEERTILAQGELMSTALFHFYLSECGESSVLLPALDFMRIDEDQEPVLPYIEEHLGRLLDRYPSEKLFITQGYICRNAFGETDNLKRGGSDYTASLVGAAIRAEEVQIWTDIDGMHNNDPRFVKNTFPIAELSFDEAAELAYFGAKILHPSSVLPAQKYNIPVRLLNTMQPQAKGTLITGASRGKNIKAVAAKDGIVAIKIKSSRMLLAYGFLRSVFEVFERYRTPIDMITTSEVAVSLTIDNTTHLSAIVKELEEFGTVEVDPDQSIVCIVGDFLQEKQGYAARVFNALRNIPIRMISYGGSKNNVSVLIDTQCKINALIALNEGLFVPAEIAEQHS